MNKFFKILINSFFVIIIIASLWSIIFVFVSWNDEIEKVIIDSRILLRAEITFLDSEWELPSESSFEKDKKAELFIIPQRDVLKLRLFDSEISEYYLKQDIKIKPSKRLQHETLRLIVGSPNFYIKNVFLKDSNLLEIELGFNKFAEIFFMLIPILLIVMVIVASKTWTSKKQKT